MLRTRPGLLLAGMLLAGCQSARMELPAGLAAEERMAVRGRQGWQIDQRLQFGPYEVEDVERSWTRGRDLRVRVWERSGRNQRYSYTLRQGEAGLHGECETTVVLQTVDARVVTIEPENRSSLSCTLRPAEAGASWSLALTEERERPLRGTLSGGGTRFEVVGVNRFERGPATSATTGYHLLQEGRVVGAVEVINGGAVWIQRAVAPAEQRLLAGAAAALLLMQDLRETLERG